MGSHACQPRATAPALTQTRRSPLLRQLAGLFRAFAVQDNDGTGTGATEIDLEEQAAYSKLATAGTQTRDVVAYAGDVRLHVAEEFTRLLGAEPGEDACSTRGSELGGHVLCESWGL
jgi:hypothetical protein